MTERFIKISIPQFGKPVIEAIGFEGGTCTDATQAFERALASAPVESREYKDSWALPETESETEQERIVW
jgi:hypothetical protein